MDMTKIHVISKSIFGRCHPRLDRLALKYLELYLDRKWVPVENLLVYDHVIALKKHKVFPAHHKKGKWIDDTYHHQMVTHKRVSHWQSLPKAPTYNHFHIVPYDVMKGLEIHFSESLDKIEIFLECVIIEYEKLMWRSIYDVKPSNKAYIVYGYIDDEYVVTTASYGHNRWYMHLRQYEDLCVTHFRKFPKPISQKRGK